MKKMTMGIVVALLFMSAIVFATPAIKKTHTGMTGKDDAKINCAYCHKDARIPKTPDQDLEAVQKHGSCAIEGCHR